MDVRDAIALRGRRIEAQAIGKTAATPSLNTHPENLPQQVFLDPRWWAEHEEAVTRRFDRWLGE